MCVRCTILNYAEPFDATLHRLCVRCATRRYPEPFNATLHRLSTVLQMSAKLFVIKLVHFTISCSNSTWATRPFLIWLNYSCLGCSVSRRKTRLSIIWPCHSFISYAILQLILIPSLYLLIYLTSLYFWWCIHQSNSSSSLGKIPSSERTINNANNLFGSILKNHSALCGKIGKCIPLNI